MSDAIDQAHRAPRWSTARSHITDIRTVRTPTSADYDDAVSQSMNSTQAPEPAGTSPVVTSTS